ncbi:HEAT repeat domain-containing protein [Thermoproteota archaeon]
MRGGLYYQLKSSLDNLIFSTQFLFVTLIFSLALVILSNFIIGKSYFLWPLYTYVSGIFYFKPEVVIVIILLILTFSSILYHNYSDFKNYFITILISIFQFAIIIGITFIFILVESTILLWDFPKDWLNLTTLPSLTSLFVAFFFLWIRGHVKIEPWIDSKEILRKNLTTSPELFRRGGPIWIDYVKKLDVEHPKTITIKKIIQEHGSVHIEGWTNSGKTCVLRRIAYDYLKLRRRVLWLSLLQIRSDIDKILSPIYHLNFPNTVLIIDDVQEDPTLCNNILSELDSGFKGTFIIASREGMENVLNWLPTRHEGYNYFEELKSEKKNITLTPTTKKEQLEIVNNFVIKKVSDYQFDAAINILQDYGHELDRLASILKIWNGEIKDLHALITRRTKSFEEDLRMMLKGSSYTFNTEPKMLLLFSSFHYPFEFPVSLSFLSDKLGKSIGLINELAKHGVLEELKDTYGHTAYRISRHPSFSKNLFQYSKDRQIITNIDQYIEESRSSYISAFYPAYDRFVFRIGAAYEYLNSKERTWARNIFFKFVTKIQDYSNDSKQSETNVVAFSLVGIQKAWAEFNEKEISDLSYQLTQLAKHSFSGIRQNVLAFIAVQFKNLKNRDTAEKILISSLKDKDSIVRTNAMSGISTNFSLFQEKNNIESLLLQHSNDSHSEVKENALLGLGNNFKYLTKKTTCEKIFYDKAQDDNPNVRTNVIAAISQNFNLLNNKNEAEDAIIEASKDTNEKVRGNAVHGINKNFIHFKNRSPFEHAIITLSQDPNSRVVNDVLQCISMNFKHLSNKVLAEKILLRHVKDKNKNTTPTAIAGLASNFFNFVDKKKAEQFILEYANDKNEIIRSNAAAGISLNFRYLTDKKTTEKILLDHSEDYYDDVRIHSIGGIGNHFSFLTDKNMAEDKLLKCSKDKNFEVRYNALLGLTKNYSILKNKKDIELLMLSRSNDIDRDTRGAAIQGIRQHFLNLDNKNVAEQIFLQNSKNEFDKIRYDALFGIALYGKYFRSHEDVINCLMEVMTKNADNLFSGLAIFGLFQLKSIPKKSYQKFLNKNVDPTLEPPSMKYKIPICHAAGFSINNVKTIDQKWIDYLLRRIDHNVEDNIEIRKLALNILGNSIQKIRTISRVKQSFEKIIENDPDDSVCKLAHQVLDKLNA